MKFKAAITLTLAFAGIISMTSCYKKHICHCNIKYSGTPGLPDSSSVEYTIQDTKGGADAKCSAQSGKRVNNGITSVETCYIY